MIEKKEIIKTSDDNMNPDNTRLPSNYRFGIFFTVIFFAVSVYFFYYNNNFWYLAFGFLSIIFLSVSFLNADIFYPLNKLWFKFGVLLGKIVSPIVMGLIFFGIFTPIAISMRFFRRDELRIKMNYKTSYWILRTETIKSDSFKNQY